MNETYARLDGLLARLALDERLLHSASRPPIR
jgi:hypothetical protein